MSKIYLGYYRYYEKKLTEVYKKTNFVEIYHGLKDLNYEMWILPTDLNIKRLLAKKSFAEYLQWIRTNPIPYWM